MPEEVVLHVEQARAAVVLLFACMMESLLQLTAIVACMISKTVRAVEHDGRSADISGPSVSLKVVSWFLDGTP